jgi:integrase
MSKSTTKTRTKKPAKPYADFPLFPHSTGRWAKKIRGKLHYFGYWNRSPGGDWQQALDLYKEQAGDLHAGRTPRKQSGGLLLKDLVNDYLNEKRRLKESGEITSGTFSEYFRACNRVIEAFGSNRVVQDLGPQDFSSLRAELAKNRGPVTLSGQIQNIRMVFKYASDQGLIEKPVRYGQSFEKPSRKVLRKAKAEAGPKMFESHELRAILSALEDQPTLKAMVLLAINCGYGQQDVASLPLTALDLDGGWSTFPRPKTGVPRRAKLWPETVDALRNVLETRPQAVEADDADLLFLTRKGLPWLRYSTADDPSKWGSRTDQVGRKFARVLRTLGINGRRGFYGIRHSFQYAAEECRDFPAIMYAMGHSDDSMSANYRERIEDSRLEAVARTVHAWLFPSGQ